MKHSLQCNILTLREHPSRKHSLGKCCYSLNLYDRSQGVQIKKCNNLNDFNMFLSQVQTSHSGKQSRQKFLDHFFRAHSVELN